MQPADIISSGEQMAVREGVKVPVQSMFALISLFSGVIIALLLGNCVACGYISSQEFCQACILLKRLNDGIPEIVVGRYRRGLQATTLRETKPLNGIASDEVGSSSVKHCDTPQPYGKC